MDLGADKIIHETELSSFEERMSAFVVVVGEMVALGRLRMDCHGVPIGYPASEYPIWREPPLLSVLEGVWASPPTLEANGSRGSHDRNQNSPCLWVARTLVHDLE